MKKILVMLLALILPCIAFADLKPLSKPVEPLPHEMVGVLFEKIENKEKINLYVLYQALQGPQTTLRAYAATELGNQGDETSIPYLIDALSDDSMHDGANYIESGMATTRYRANESLKKLTGEDFGFISNDSKEKRIKAMIRWREWYLEGKRTNQNNNLNKEIIESWGRQKEFFLKGNFEIIQWEEAKEVLLSKEIKGGKQYHTGWLTIYTLDGDKYLTNQPGMDAFWEFMEKNKLNLEGFGAE